MSLLRPTNSFGRGSAPAPSPGGGGVGVWTNITAAEMSTDLGGYTTFSLTNSAVSGYNLRVSINCDLLVTSGTFPINTAATIYFDTGITKDDLGDGDSRIAVIQTMLEMNGLDSTSDYQTDTTHEHSIMPFISTSTPSFSSGNIGFFGLGVTFRSGIRKLMERILRDTLNSSDGGTLVGGTGQLIAIANETTFTIRDSPNNSSQACMFRYDSLAYWNNSGSNALLKFQNATLYDSDVSALTGSETVKIGVAFHMNKTQDASETKTWDINLKFRKLLV